MTQGRLYYHFMVDGHKYEIEIQVLKHKKYFN